MISSMQEMGENAQEFDGKSNGFVTLRWHADSTDAFDVIYLNK